MTAKLRRAVALLSLLSVVASVLLAGKGYFFCPWMERAAASCCHATERATGDVPALSRGACCDRRTIAMAPSAPTDLLRQGLDVRPAQAFSGELIRIVDARAIDAPKRVQAREHGARAGPPAPLFELHSVYLI